ncbi:Os10g0548000, partial [Oryza sativa Japonica Group]
RGSFAGDVGRRRGSGCADDEVSGLTEEEAARAGFGCRCPCSPGARCSSRLQLA